VLEALEYYAQNRTLIDLEAAEERRRAQLSAAPAAFAIARETDAGVG